MPRLVVCLVLTWALSLLSGSARWLQPQSQTEADTEARRIISRALDRADSIRQQGRDADYRYEITRYTRRLDGDGSLRSEETRAFDVAPLHGVPYRRLVSRNGRPLTAAEQTAERKREQAFLEHVRRGQEARPEVPEDEIRFNEQLVSRYVFTQEATEAVGGRPAYRLSFEPRSGRLPIRQQIDRALNRSQGAIWIDSETYEIARVRFALIHPVRVWWGITGRINDVRGDFNRFPLTDEVWMPAHLTTYLDLRVLFRSTRREETTTWTAFERVNMNQ